MARRKREADDIVAIGRRDSFGVVGEMRFVRGDDPDGEKGAFCIWHREKKNEICRVTRCCKCVTNCHKRITKCHKCRYQLSHTRYHL